MVKIEIMLVIDINLEVNPTIFMSTVWIEVIMEQKSRFVQTIYVCIDDLDHDLDTINLVDMVEKVEGYSTQIDENNEDPIFEVAY